MANRDVITRAGAGVALNATQNDQNLSSLASTTEEQTGSTYAVAFTDQNKLIELNNAAMVCTMPDVATTITSSDTTSWHVVLKNTNAADATINPTGANTFDGASSLTLVQNETVVLQTNAANNNWLVIGRWQPGLLGLLNTSNTWTGALNDFTNDVTLGSSGADTVTLNGVITGDLVPSANNTYDLGGGTGTSYRDLYLIDLARVGRIIIGGSGVIATTILDQDDMASNSATALVSQQSVKAYVDNTPAYDLLQTLSADGYFTAFSSTYSAYRIVVTRAFEASGGNVLQGRFYNVSTPVGDLLSMGTVASSGSAAAVVDITWHNEGTNRIVTAGVTSGWGSGGAAASPFRTGAQNTGGSAPATRFRVWGGSGTFNEFEAKLYGLVGS